jgi:filamentous hemagglutinin family protein
MSGSSAKSRQRGDFKPKLIALSVATCFSLSTAQSLANPTGGTVSSGSASFASSGNTLTITNSANAIINWQSFSIGVNEITRFLQISGSSAVLNRVVGANGVIPQSVIDGVLSSNGRVFLLNSSGIVIGSSARIDVAGFVASSLNLSDQDFLNGRLRFTETSGAGAVTNAGAIDTSAGGRVFLVGPDVQNSGVIRSPRGEIVLAAGKSVELVSENSPFVTVHLVADTERALNVGQMIADSGRIGMFGALVRHGGVAEANSAVVGASGEIRLIATQDLTLDVGSRTTANGPSGGSVTLQAQGGTNLISGTVEARGSSGQGGTIQALGVRVGVIGAGVIDASGNAGGGTVLVGGDAHGANPNVQNALQTMIGPDGIIRADAGTTGDGGRVIVWSDESTKFFGSISARGGAQSGNGGFVETSGKALQAFGRVDTSAPNGNGGNWLLDPLDITISATGITQLSCITAVTGICFDTPGTTGTTSDISVATLNASLFATSVTLQAHHDINLLTNLNLTYGGGKTFTAQAGNNINLHGLVSPLTGGPAVDTGFNITTSGANVTLKANDTASLTASGTGSITSLAGSGNITTSGGNVSLYGFRVTVGAINTSGPLGAGSVTIASLSDTSRLASIALTASVKQATNFPVTLGTVDQKVKKDDDKKAAAVCK